MLASQAIKTKEKPQSALNQGGQHTRGGKAGSTANAYLPEEGTIISHNDIRISFPFQGPSPSLQSTGHTVTSWQGLQLQRWTGRH